MGFLIKQKERLSDLNAEILCIGTELLHGDIVNTNAAAISKALASIGVDVYYQSVVGDNPARMKEAIDLAVSRADVIITTGGLGPTLDDITKEAFAERFGQPMVFHQASLNHVREIYSQFHKDIPQNNMRQAYFPQGAKILSNPNGTANACILKYIDEQDREKIAVLLPGPPYEMIPILTEQVLPYLKTLSKMVVYGVKVAVTKLGESKAEMMILDMIEGKNNPTIAPYAGKGQVIFRVTAKETTKEKCKALIDPIVQELLNRFGANATILEEGNMEHLVAKLLVEQNITFATAESCTGGMISSKLVSYPGISAAFLGGVVCYSNQLKNTALGVGDKTLELFGAVSMETAREMAKGVLDFTGADMGISITGIAGPDGGTKAKPVGTVYSCIYFNGQYHDFHWQLSGSRDIIRERGTNLVLDQVRRILQRKIN